jgi:WD40 repeat protein
MRRALKFVAVAAWLGGHAFLWTLLPPVPRWSAAEIAPPHSIAFTPDGRSLVTCDSAAVTVWAAVTGQREHSWSRPGKRPNRDDFKSLLVMSPIDRRAIVYDTRSGSRELPYLIDLDNGSATALPAWQFLITAEDPCIGFLPDGRTAFQIDAVLKPKIDVFMRVWALPDGPARSIPIGWRLDEPLSVPVDGRLAAAHLRKTATLPDTILLLDLVAGRVTRELTFGPAKLGTTVYPRRVVRGALSPDGRTLAVSATFVFGAGADSMPDVELWDTETGRMLRAVGSGFAPGWNAAGQLVIHDGEYSRLINGVDGQEIVRWPTSIDRNPMSAELTTDRRRVSYRNYRRRPDAIRWLLDHLPGHSLDPDEATEVCVVDDAQTGNRLAAIQLEPMTTVALAADGSALATLDGASLRVWDIPPRTPGGVVLGLMIVEVGMAIAWTGWRRRLLRKVRNSSTSQQVTGLQ